MADCKSLEELLGGVHRIDTENVKAEDVFSDIANNLFKHYVIRKGGETFRFLELELYYHSDKHPDNFVYPRNCAVSGSFLIHSSGVDICFKNIGSDIYGGILLRHLLRIDETQHKSVVAGPWDCCDAIFNYTNEGTHPYLSVADNDFDSSNLACACRYNAKGNMAEKDYCFYDIGCKIKNANDWGENGFLFKRYNPTTREEQKNNYSPKPWNRK